MVTPVGPHLLKLPKLHYQLGTKYFSKPEIMDHISLNEIISHSNQHKQLLEEEESVLFKCVGTVDGQQPGAYK